MGGSHARSGRDVLLHAGCRALALLARERDSPGLDPPAVALLLGDREHLRVTLEAPDRTQHHRLAVLLVALLGEAQFVLSRLHVAFAVAALAVEVVEDNALRLPIVAIPGFASVGCALASQRVLVVQEL